MADDVDVEGASDTAHLYEGKKVRSSAPSRRKAAGRIKSRTSSYLLIEWSLHCRPVRLRP